MPRPLYEQLSSFTQSETTINRWNNLTRLLIKSDRYETKKIDASIADSFRSDFFGLLKNKFDVPDQYLYPHLIINNLPDPTAYAGETSIKIINPQALATLYALVK